MRLRVFDDPTFDDRYTVVIDTRDETDGAEDFRFISMNCLPFSEKYGVCRYGTLNLGWLEDPDGVEIPFTDLPADCQKVIFVEFMEWPQTKH